MINNPPKEGIKNINMKQGSAEANLIGELNKLKTLVGKDTEEFIKQHDFLLEHFNTEKEQKIIHDFVEKAMKESVRKIDDFVEEAKVKVQLINITKIISLSYVSEHYFNRTRNWLYQKINGNKVNGKSVQFTAHEIETLNFAIQDISKKLGSTVISL
ncbi:MAG: DUF5053 domain-containing protein [Tannerella sp.]|nr:DUF5053 domain-containing protein [Tannerella sp.]